jgi:hypothetical protein
MAFTGTDNTVYKKITLARVEHSQFIPSFTDLGSGVYRFSNVSRVVARVLRNGVALTKVSAPPTSSDEYSVDESSQTVDVKLASPPNDTSNILTFITRLFFTNERARVLAEDPSSAISASNPLRDWEPRLSSVPIFRQSVSNNLSGILTTSSSTLKVINTQNDLNSLVGLNGSFSNSAADIWLALDSVDNIDKVYSGIVTGAMISDKEFTFKLTDITSKLNSPAWLGDDESEAYYRVEDNSSLDPLQDQQARRLYVGPNTRHSTRPGSAITGLTDPLDAVFDSMEIAANTNLENTPSTTDNRDWDVGRRFSGVQTTDATIAAVVAGGNGSDYFTFTPSYSATSSKYHIGQSVNYPSSAVEHRIVKLHSNGDISTTWNTGDATPSVSDVVAGASVSIYLRGITSNNSVTYVPASNYTVNSTATSGGNVIISIVFDDNFEAGIADFGGNPLDANLHQVRFISAHSEQNTAADPLQHDDVLNLVLQRADMVGGDFLNFVNNTTKTTNLQFSVPYFDELDYGVYRDYVETLLLTTNGVLYTSADDLIYDEITIPTATSNPITIDDTLQGSRRLEVDYRDVAYITTGFNPHSPVNETGISSDKHRLLHQTSKATRFRHIAVELDTDVLDLRAKLNRNRKGSYSYASFARDLDSKPMDEVALKHDVTTDITGTTSVFITEISKAITETKVKTSDLLDD